MSAALNVILGTPSTSMRWIQFALDADRQSLASVHVSLDGRVYVSLKEERHADEHVLVENYPGLGVENMIRGASSGDPHGQNRLLRMAQRGVVAIRERREARS